MRNWIFRCLPLAALAFGSVGALAQAASPTLPGGATALRETFDDWQVACTVQAGVKHCGLSQQQFGQNRQRLLGIEFMPANAEGLAGTLVLPFGLLLENGVAGQIDDKSLGARLKFRTCLPAGCIVPLSFNAATVASLRAGAVLKIAAEPSQGGEPITFTVSLKGFSGALERAARLLK